MRLLAHVLSLNGSGVGASTDTASPIYRALSYTGDGISGSPTGVKGGDGSWTRCSGMEACCHCDAFAGRREFEQGMGNCLRRLTEETIL